MRLIEALFDEEAAVAVGVVASLVAVAVAFGAPLTPEQTGAVLAVLPAVAALLTRVFVWSEESVRGEVSDAVNDGASVGYDVGFEHGASQEHAPEVPEGVFDVDV